MKLKNQYGKENLLTMDSTIWIRVSSFIINELKDSFRQIQGAVNLVYIWTNSIMVADDHLSRNDLDRV